MLVKKYKEYKAEGGAAAEVVFISSDQDKKTFDSYYGEMPWPALPFEFRREKGQLSKAFHVRGIPSLLVLDGNSGKLISKEGRSEFEKYLSVENDAVAAAEALRRESSEAEDAKNISRTCILL